MTERTISADDKLRAFALFTMAKEHHAKAEEFAAALNRTLGLAEDDFGSTHLSDAIFGGDASFEVALAREGFVVETAKSIGGLIGQTEKL